MAIKTSPNQRIKVIFLSGAGRSGGTIIANVLAELPGFISVGEPYQIYNNNILDNELCGCGKPLRECQFWQPIIQDVYRDISLTDFLNLRALRDQYIRTRSSLLMGIPAYRNRIFTLTRQYIQTQESLYQAIQAQTGCQFIVDTSRIPSYGWLVHSMKSVDLNVIHLVRDPRAVSYSWLRVKSRPTATGVVYGLQKHPASSALVWLIQNIVTEVLAHHISLDHKLRITYEMFTENPQGTVKRICELLGATEALQSPALRALSSSLDMGIHHTFAGNSSRFLKGHVRLAPDMEWKTKLSARDYQMVTLLTWPLLAYYGYGNTGDSRAIARRI